MTLSQKSRKLIYERDEWVCVSCGTLRDLTIHHRVNRGSGGSKLFNGLAFLLTMCSGCNSGFESSAESADAARILGYKISRNAKPPIDPETVPVRYYKHGTWFLLDQQGNKKETNE